MPSVTNIEYTNSQSIDYVTYDAAREVTDLVIDDPLVVNLINLSWSHSTTPGTYVVWYFDGLDWVNSGASTTATSITVDLPTDALLIQLRNNDQPSNNAPIIYQPLAPDVSISATNRYDGVKISWSPFVSDNIEIKRGSTIIYQGIAPSLAYFVDTAATETSANYTAMAYIGDKPTDYVDSLVSNTVSGFKLAALPYPEPNPIPADCFLGIKPGTGIVDTGTDELGNPVAPIPAEGRFVITSNTGVEADLIGTSVDLDDTTYFHSDNSYVFVDSIHELTQYSESFGTRKFTLTTALKTALDTGSVFLVRVDKDTTTSYAAPIFKRSLVSSDTYVTDDYSLDTWWFSGGGQVPGHYETGHTTLVTETTVDSVKFYFLNLSVVSSLLTYNSRTKTNLEMTPQVGGPGEVYIDGTYFRVNGVDFGTLNFLCNLGVSTDSAFVANLRNVYDDIIPMGNGASVDAGLNHYGTGTCFQVLGSSPGASGWYMDYENGRIWRDVSGNEADWWNAAKGRTRLKYESSSSNSGGTPYTTAAVNIGLPTPDQLGGPSPFRFHSSTVGITPVTQVLADVTVDMGTIYDTSVFGVIITPKSWELDDEGNYGQSYTEDKQTIIFSDFGVDTDYIPIYKYYRERTSVPEILAGGEPWLPNSFTINAIVYLARTSTNTFRLHYSYTLLAKDGSCTEAGNNTPIGGIQLRIPSFSFSFLQMR